MTEAKEKLKQEINRLENESTIQNLLMYLMGIKAQEKITLSKSQVTPAGGNIMSLQ